MGNSNSIAVIIPAYNSVRYLKETLDSVMHQTLPPVEVLVNDDGSTDGTPDLAESYGAPIRVFRRSHQGPSASRNFAASQSSCEWLAFIDSDDLWEPAKLHQQMEELERHPQADLCYCARVAFEEENGAFRRGRVYPVPPADRIREALFRNTTFLPSSVLIRRSTFLSVGGFDPAIRFCEDWDLWLRLLHRGVRFAACAQPLLLYRQHEGNQSANAFRLLDAEKDVYRRLVLPHLPPYSRWLRCQRTQSRQETVAAYTLRQGGDPRHLGLLARAILRYPFTDPHRYKVFAHMIYTRLGMAHNDQGNADRGAKSL